MKKRLIWIIIPLFLISALALMVSLKLFSPPQGTKSEEVLETSHPELLPAADIPIKVEDKIWSDPNLFTLNYPPEARAIHTNNQTLVSEASAQFQYQLYFCKDCQVPTCQGPCTQKGTLELALKKSTITLKTRGPDFSGQTFFSGQMLYPSRSREEYLQVFGSFKKDTDWERINTITQTFEFVNDFLISKDEALRLIRNLPYYRDLTQDPAFSTTLEHMYEDEAKNAWVIGLYQTDEDGVKRFQNQFFVEKYTGEISTLFATPVPTY